MPKAFKIVTRRVGPTLEGSLAEWKAGEVTLKQMTEEKTRRFLWATVPPLLAATAVTACVGYGKHELEQLFGSDEAAMIATKLLLLAIPLGMTLASLLMMLGMHLASDVPPVFNEEVKSLGPRSAPSDNKTWEQWLYEGVRIGRWQSMDGSGRAGAVARIPIMDEMVFIAARTRWGKSTVLWAIMDDLEEGIRQGAVRIVMFDPKNGMEMGSAVKLGYVKNEDFYYGEDVGEIDPETGELEVGGKLYEETFIKPLEDLVALMRKRADKIRFKDRRHHAKPGDPHVVVIVDEAAQLMRETTPAKIRNRINNAFLTLEHQGAACGFTVIACTQHPSVEEIGPIRHGLTFGLAGKLKAARAVDMVLGEGARAHGSKADKLDRRYPGVFYTSESGPLVLRACNSGPEYYDESYEPPMIETTREDEKQADKLWQRIVSRKSAFRRAA